MEDHNDSGMSRSDSKLIGEKRGTRELGDKQDVDRKQTKMRHLDSVSNTGEMNLHHFKKKEGIDQFHFGEEMSQVTNVPITLDLEVASRTEKSGRTTFSIEASPLPGSVDLNTEAYVVTNTATVVVPERGEKCNEAPLLEKRVGSAVTGLDLNAEHISSVNQEQFSLHKKPDRLKLGVASECESTTGPVEEKDPLRIWKEMKKNGFLSPSQGGVSIQSSFMPSAHGGIHVPKKRVRKTRNDILKKNMELAKQEHVPKKRVRKTRNDILKKNMELAKQEQVDRFTKIAAPSGLLNGLNPGIVNNVRNRKQVHSIIEALVRPETDRIQNKQATCPQSRNEETIIKYNSGMDQLGLCHRHGGSTAICGIEETGIHFASGRGTYTSLVDRACSMELVSNSAAVVEDDTLALKLSSLAKASDESSTFYSGDWENSSSVSYLSVRAASVSSQWLELLHQDIKGRLSALRRNKKRVRAVITTELPFLMAKEFSSHQENDSYNVGNSSDALPSNATAAMHQTRWNTVFSQMDKALSEEEKQLESWLNQVKDMQLHCDKGLQNFHHSSSIFGFQQQGTSEYYTRPGKADSSDKELAVRAAAASIYSTCNFVMSKENVACF